MVKKNKAAFAILCSVLLAVTMLLTVPPASVWAEGSDADPTDKVDKKELYEDAIESGEELEGQGVHADPATFEKNFCLTPDQKEYAITGIEKVVSLCTSPGMSDLEKYYNLGKWVNQRVIYDGDFWNGQYNMDYYSHQWDAYGAINEDEMSVCAGIAIFYSNVCHAADLPCKFVRLDPKILDHTITYIPDINEHAYYADITENDFLMSKEACIFADEVDKEFAGITKDPDDGTFEFSQDKRDSVHGSNIKDCWQEKVSYKKWFKEYAKHEDTDKIFGTEYVEMGSGDGTLHRSYQNFANYPAQPYESRARAGEAGNVTGIWFLDDFYKEPAAAERMIRNREFDKQFLNVSGENENYDCATIEELEAAVNDTVSVRYFPSVENGEVVAKAAKLNNGVDYTLTYDPEDPVNDLDGDEVFTLQGTGNYSGTYQLHVRMNSASVKTPPTRINGLVYNGKAQNLITPGEGFQGTMVYAASKPGTEPADKDYTEAVPAETNGGAYDVWYKVIGDENHCDMPAQKLERPVRIEGMPIEGLFAVKLSQSTFTYNGKVQKPVVKVYKTKLQEGIDYEIVWKNASSQNAGEYEVEIRGIGNYSGSDWEYYLIKKAANPMSLKALTAKVQRSEVKISDQVVERAKVLTVNKAQGAPTYKIVSVKKGKKKIKGKFVIDAATGDVTVKQGLKKGTYKVKVKVKAAGDENYKASVWKKTTFKIKVI